MRCLLLIAAGVVLLAYLVDAGGTGTTYNLTIRRHDGRRGPPPNAGPRVAGATFDAYYMVTLRQRHLET